jgi:hypothetical protein
MWTISARVASRSRLISQDLSCGKRCN